MKHTALYLRVSTEAQADEGYSLAAQAEKLEAYCRMKGISRFTRYVDGGFSGSSLNRPAVTQLIDCIRNGEVERVVVYKLDRLSRSQKDTLYLIEDVFAPHSVDFVSINENIDTGTPYGRAMIGILSAFAQLERENIFLRTRMGMVERVRQGFWPGGGKIPFGYDYDPAKGILVPNSDADTVREIYARYLSGESAGSIARALGLRYEHLVRQILDRESNTGVIVYKGERYPGRHEPLIDRETWLRAQRRLHRPNRPRAADGGKLLTGLLVCGHCGAKCATRNGERPATGWSATRAISPSRISCMTRTARTGASWRVMSRKSCSATLPGSPRSRIRRAMPLPGNRLAAGRFKRPNAVCAACTSCTPRTRTIRSVTPLPPRSTAVTAPPKRCLPRSSRPDRPPHRMTRKRRCEASAHAGTA